MATVNVLVEYSVTYSKIVTMEINDEIVHDLGGKEITYNDITEYNDFCNADFDIEVPSGKDVESIYKENSLNFESFKILTDSVSYDDGVLTIRYEKYGSENRNYDSLFDFLGDFDIITASEIGEDIIIMSEEVFKFTKKDELSLGINGFVKLDRICCLEEYLDMEDESHVLFNEWYSNQ